MSQGYSTIGLHQIVPDEVIYLFDIIISYIKNFHRPMLLMIYHINKDSKCIGCSFDYYNFLLWEWWLFQAPLPWAAAPDPCRAHPVPRVSQPSWGNPGCFYTGAHQHWRLFVGSEFWSLPIGLNSFKRLPTFCSQQLFSIFVFICLINSTYKANFYPIDTILSTMDSRTVAPSSLLKKQPFGQSLCLW